MKVRWTLFLKKLKDGEAYLRLNPCLSHSLCLGRPQTCITTTSTYIPAEGEHCQSKIIAKTGAVLESQNKNIPAVAIVFAGFGLGLGLVGFVSAIAIAFSKWRHWMQKEKVSLICENPNPLYSNYYFQESNERCNIEVEAVDRNELYGLDDSDKCLG